MTWSSVNMQWPAQSTAWMDQLAGAQALASHELGSTGDRLASLADRVQTNPGPVGEAAQGAIAAGRAALQEQLSQAPACLLVTPFQSGVGQGRGHQRYLSAPNLLQVMADKLLEDGAVGQASGDLHALSIMFLGTSFADLASVLSRFNALMPMPDLVRAERRAGQLSRLESEKWEIPVAAPLPRWQSLPVERCTVLKTMKQAMAGQVAVLEGYAADSSPMADLAALSQRKAAQQLQRDGQMADLHALLAGGVPDERMKARLVGPGDVGQLRRELLAVDAPGHEWVLSAGVVLVGSLPGLALVREMVGL